MTKGDSVSVIRRIHCEDLVYNMVNTVINAVLNN